MDFPADYHMHTPLCGHAMGEPVEYAARALALGLPEIGFSEHSPMPREDFDDWRMRLSDLDLYLAKVEAARRQFPQLPIRVGLEVDYLPGHEPWIRELAQRHQWDYFIGSVHYLGDDWAIDNPNHISKWRGRDPFETWSAYFATLARAAESGLFDIIGHADLCKKFAIYPRQDCTPLYEQFLQAARQGGVAMELNTAGLRKDCREIYPAAQMVKMAAHVGVPITFGSDAHAPGEVGMGFSEALASARAAGVTHYGRFHRRQRELVPIPGAAPA